MLHHHDKVKDTKTIASFLVLLLAFSCLLLFWQYGEDILQAGNFNMFIVMVFGAMGLFAGFLFLISKEGKTAKVKAKSKTKKRK